MLATAAIEKGLLASASYFPSAHCNERPAGEIINLLVIHNISLPPGIFGGSYIHDFFCGKLVASAHPYFESIASLKVAPHLFINRQGEASQFVPFHQRAWHAGESCFLGKPNCNDYSVGIELEGVDTVPYTPAQYGTLIEVIDCLMRYYPAITVERIVGHSHIAPGRKTDPGEAFDWNQLIKGLQKEVNAS